MSDDISAMDLTGSDPAFYREDKRFMVFTSNQILGFEEPAYAGTIKVYKLNDDSTSEELVLYTDWSVPSSLQDTDAISRCKLRDNTFNDNLVTGIQINRVYDEEEYQVSIKYQALYRDASSYASGATGPSATPELMLAICRDLDYLMKVKDPLQDNIATTLGNLKILEEDYTGVAEVNHVYNEDHEVNVPNNCYIIRPGCGSFYNYDLQVVFDGTELVQNRDYIVRGVNHGKTRVSSHNSGVYEYIILTAAIVGTVTISYHAFGGEVTPADFYLLKDEVLRMAQLFEQDTFVTTDDLAIQPTIVELGDRITVLEELLNHYDSQSFTFSIPEFEQDGKTYNVETWVDIATISHGPWSDVNPIPTIGMGSFRVALTEFNVTADFNLTFNLSAGTLVVSGLVVHGNTYKSDGIDYFADRVVLKLRLIYNSNDYEHGLILQLAVASMTATATEVIVYDRTGSATMWTLIDSLGNERTNASAQATLPDDTEWNPKSSNSKIAQASVTTNIAYILGNRYTAWAGAINLNELEAVTYREGEVPVATDNTWIVDSTTPEILHIELGGTKLAHSIGSGDIDVRQLRGLRVTVYDRYIKQNIVETSYPLVTGSTEPYAVEADIMYYPQDLCSLHLYLAQTTTTVKVDDTTEQVLYDYTLRVRAYSGTNSLVNERFDLKQIDLLA